MTWDDVVSAWARAFDGYDLRFAPAFKRSAIRGAFRVAAVLDRFGIRPAATMVLSALCSVAVPLLAWRGGVWPALAAVALVAGLGTDLLTAAMAVYGRRLTRLGSFYQSLLDRFGEVCWLIAFALLGVQPFLVIVAVAMVWAHEYLRARASLGKGGSGTIGERPSWIRLTLIGLVLAAGAAQLGQDLAAGVATLVVFSWVCLAGIGLAQLVAVIRKALA